MNKISAYFKDSYKELVERVSWPTWQQLQQTTMIVIGATIFVVFIVAIMDFIINGKVSGSPVGILSLIYKMF